MDQPIPPTPSHRRTNHRAGSPSPDLLITVYENLPVLVVHLTTDGTVLHANPEVTRVTGYSAADLLGKNFWALLFPGRLFSQVPKFVSAIHPLQLLANDVPMTLRTRIGEERTIAWSRFVHEGPAHADTGSASIVCIGTDLTNRLLDADKATTPPLEADAPLDADTLLGEQMEMLAPFGPIVTDAVEGDFITPLAITPPTPAANGGITPAIEQVHEFLTQIDGRIAAMETAFAQGEWSSLADIATSLRNGAHVCGLLDFCTRAERLRAATTAREMEEVTTLVTDIMKICRPENA